jgi:hypothetical protein
MVSDPLCPAFVVARRLSGGEVEHWARVERSEMFGPTAFATAAGSSDNNQTRRLGGTSHHRSCF